MSFAEWSPGSAHYTHFLGPIVREMSIDDLVKEAKRNPFEAEIQRRLEDAELRMNHAQEHKNTLRMRIEEARERFKHL